MQVFFNPFKNNHLVNYLTCSFIISPDFQDNVCPWVVTSALDPDDVTNPEVALRSAAWDGDLVPLGPRFFSIRITQFSWSSIFFMRTSKSLLLRKFVSPGWLTTCVDTSISFANLLIIVSIAFFSSWSRPDTQKSLRQPWFHLYNC